MSFTINFYKNGSPVNKVDKSLTATFSAEGALRTGASILDPVIMVESSTPANLITSSNYAYIAEFSRYYYITGVTSDANGLWVVGMHVDVLMSYKEQIRSQSAIVARQEFVYNMYLDDGWFLAYQNPEIQVKLFSEATPFEAEEYILVIAGCS